MNITEEKTGNLTSTIHIEMVKDDYEAEVSKVLKDYQKKANIPGFRPGKVPMGMIKKQYGTAVTADEVNKKISESLNNYITEKKLRILGNPLPNMEKTKRIDFDHDEILNFYFDIGLAPEVDFELSDGIKVDYYEIEPDKKTVDDYIMDMRKRHGDTETPDESGDEDILRGNIVMVDKEQNPIEGKEPQQSTVSIAFIKEEKIKEQFLGKKPGDQIIFNPFKATDNLTEASYMIGNREANKEDLDADYQFGITEILRIIPAKLNEDFYKKVYPQENIKDEEELRTQVMRDATQSFASEGDKKFMNDAIGKILEEANLELPDEFLKRWLKEDIENKISDEDIENEYDQYAKALKWQLIESKILKDNNVEIKEEDIRNFIRGYFSGQIPKPEGDEEYDKRLEGIVDSVMQNHQEIEKIYEQLKSDRVKEVLKNTLKLKTKKISYDDFIKLASK